jgi:hypothetical protein
MLDDGSNFWRARRFNVRWRSACGGKLRAWCDGWWRCASTRDCCSAVSEITLVESLPVPFDGYPYPLMVLRLLFVRL